MTAESAGARPEPVTRRGRRTRESLLEAARRVFATVPFERAKVTDITDAAGVAAGTFYTYFDTKEEIFRVVAGEVLVEMSQSPRRRPDDPDDPIAAIVASTRRYFQVCVRHGQIARSLEQFATVDAEVSAARRGVVIDGVDRAAAWIRRLQAEGLASDDSDPWALALALHTMTVRVAYDHLLHPGGADDLDRLADAVGLIWARSVGLVRW